VQFNSYLFACFFAVVLAVHYSPLPWSVRKVALLVFSYAFYAAWDPPFVLLLIASTIVDWFVAKAMARSDDGARRRALLLVSLVFNLGLLLYFKYAGWLLGITGVVLPIGISFYTFMTISYTIDVYLRRAAPARHFLDYALYVTFFPHLVSGPIVRATELVPRFGAPRGATGGWFGWGLALVVLGLFEKAVVADGLLAPVVEHVYAPARTSVSTLDAWLGTLSFAGQIFCDFAGYSTCAIGVALCLGFSLPENFHFPYAAIGFSDFWRRWHISLSSWLRDYLYIPLGGNRKGPTRTQVNLVITMLLGGLWHGASWTFVVWGGLHGLYLVGERVARRAWGRAPFWSTAVGHALLGLVTFLLVCVAWVFFRAASFGQAFRIVAAMAGAGAGAARLDDLPCLIPVGLLLLAQWLLRDTTLERVVTRAPIALRVAALSAMIFSLALFPGTDRAFIYFQF